MTLIVNSRNSTRKIDDRDDNDAESIPNEPNTTYYHINSKPLSKKGTLHLRLLAVTNGFITDLWIIW